ncbi:hypothetical protein BKM35_22210 [Salmonella enterica]|nr:hypothetical protein [Salmonella enterica]
MPIKQQSGAGLLDKAIELIEWVDSGKKLLVVIILVCFGIAAYSVWESRIDITKYLMKEFAVVEINPAAIDSESISLIKELGAVSVSVWSADPARNRRTRIYFRTVDGLNSSDSDKSDVLFRSGSETLAPTVDLLNTREVCLDVPRNSTIEIPAGVTFVCAVSVPPAYSDGFIGVLVLGFRKRPPHEDYVLQRMGQASQAIIK